MATSHHEFGERIRIVVATIEFDTQGVIAAQARRIVAPDAQACEIFERASIGAGLHQQVREIHGVAVCVGVVRDPGDADLLNRWRAIGGEFDERCRTQPAKISRACGERIECRVRARSADFETEIDADQLG